MKAKFRTMMNPLVNCALRPWSLLGAVLIAAVVSTSVAEGHEFWIDPEDFSVETSSNIVANIRVGEDYEGTAYSFIPRNFRLFDLAQNQSRQPVEGRMGDKPALNQPLSEDGLAVLLHVTSDSKLTYSEFAKFEKFVTHKDADWTIDAHRARGLPDEGFVEAYSRYAKSLVAVGEGAGSDQVYGLLTELVAGANPYTDDLAGGFPVTLYYEGKPRSDAQIEVFEKSSDGTVEISTVRTDAQGRAMVPVRPGHRYMLDAVVLREPEPAVAEKLKAVWESLWANLTFATPG